MPIISRFPQQPPAKWVLEETTYEDRHVVGLRYTSGNAYVADMVLWDKKTGVLLRSGDGVTVMTNMDFYRKYSFAGAHPSIWVWFDPEMFGETAYFVRAVEKAGFGGMNIDHSKMVAIKPK